MNETKRWSATMANNGIGCVYIRPFGPLTWGKNDFYGQIMTIVAQTNI